MRFGYLRSQLFEEAGEGTGAGGSEGAVALDAKAVQALIDKSLNGHSKRLETQFGAKFNEFGSKFDELMSKLNPQSGNEGKGGDGKHHEEMPPAIQARLDDERRKREALEKSFNTLAEEKKRSDEEASTSKRNAKLKDVIGSLDLADKKQAEDLFDKFYPKVKNDADGNLIVGDTTLESAIRDHYEKSPWLHPKVPVNGSGASANRSGKSAGVDMSTPLKTKDDIAKFAAEIQRVAKDSLAAR